MSVAKTENHELQAFFRACKKNGIPVSATPNFHNRRGSVVIGDGGERYIITPDMKIQFQTEQNADSATIRAKMPQFIVGDTVRVHVRIKEGVRERIQIFEGVCIAKQHGGIAETFTVRRVAHGVGVERVFSLHSPSVMNVEVLRKGRVRRGKLYYLRGRAGKAKTDKNINSRDIIQEK